MRAITASPAPVVGLQPLDYLGQFGDHGTPLIELLLCRACLSCSASGLLSNSLTNSASFVVTINLTSLWSLNESIL